MDCSSLPLLLLRKQDSVRVSGAHSSSVGITNTATGFRSSSAEGLKGWRAFLALVQSHGITALSLSENRGGRIKDRWQNDPGARRVSSLQYPPEPPGGGLAWPSETLGDLGCSSCVRTQEPATTSSALGRSHPFLTQFHIQLCLFPPLQHISLCSAPCVPLFNTS